MVFFGKKNNWKLRKVFKILEKRDYVVGHGYRFMNAMRFDGNRYYHSVAFDPKTGEYTSNKAANTESGGCIVSSANNAEWLYNNCKVGTKVIVINKSYSN